MIAGRDIRLDAAGLLQLVGEQGGGGSSWLVDGLAAELKLLVAMTLAALEMVLVRLRAIGFRRHSRSALIERPGIHLAFPVVDDLLPKRKGSVCI